MSFLKPKLGFFAKLRKFRIPIILLLVAIGVLLVSFGWSVFLI